MPRNPLELSHAHAEKAHKDLARIIAKLGTKQHPRGSVLTAYARARREIAGLLNSGAGRYEVQRALDALRAELTTATMDALNAGWDVGDMLARRQLTAYDVTPPAEQRDYEYMALALETVMQEVQTQQASVLALIAAGLGVALIIGDAQRQGVLRPAPVIRSITDWAFRASDRSSQQTVENVPSAPYFQRQAYAAIDGRTTDCCLRVHGQIVELDEDFNLTGTPRFADRMYGPPFHDWCRTVWALYQVAYDDGFTERMQARAQGEMNRRAEEAAAKRAEQREAAREPVKYRRSRTAAEAEQWAREAGVTADYGGQLGTANVTNRVIEDLQLRGVNTDFNVKVDDNFFADRPNTDAAYRVKDNTVMLRSRSTTTAAYRQELVDGGFWSSGDIYSTKRHEILHAVNRNAPNQSMRLTEAQAQVASQVSRYATVDRGEFLAETGTGILSGKTYGNDVMNLYREFGGVEIGQRR